jgi:N-acetyl-anhydromuramyl-L-alanine amidase AmpD
MGRITVIETNLQFVKDLTERASTNRIYVHHVGEITRDVSAAEIHDWHLKNPGWAGIGYHYVIRKDGTVERGRPKWAIGSHALGANYNSVGICVVGDSSIEPITPEQRRSLVLLLADLCGLYEIWPSRGNIFGHREVSGDTECPGETLYNDLDAIVDDVARERGVL